MRIGLLEDDVSQIELISLWAKETGDDLKSYETGQLFREGLATEEFDLLIVDWQLPDTTGIQELDWIRAEKSSTIPVIFITSLDSEECVMEALDHGADDYMVKPVSKGVTLSRLKALERRNRINTESEAASPENENFEPYEINQEEFSISNKGEKIKLTVKEFELAAYLFRNAGNLVTRDFLLENIWDTRSDLNTRTVDTHVSRIRSKLGISPNNGWQLSSIYQRGYRLARVTPE